jgi:DNA-directed RNA polymerase specialized sigma24 family protein
MTRFRLLGPLEVLVGDDWRAIGAPKWRSVLAALLIHPGQIVSAGTLISEVWGDEPATPFEGEALFARECLDRAHDELSELHRQVIDLHVLGPHAATATARLIGDGMSEANVNQIASRFQKRFRELLDEGDSWG